MLQVNGRHYRSNDGARTVTESETDKDQPYHKGKQADDGFLHRNRCADVEDNPLRV